MTAVGQSLLIHWDGQIIDTPDGASYDKGHLKIVQLSREMNYKELQAIIKAEMNLGDQFEITKIIFRVPIFDECQITEHSIFEIKTDEHVFKMFSGVYLVPGMIFIELYIEYNRMSVFRNHVSEIEGGNGDLALDGDKHIDNDDGEKGEDVEDSDSEDGENAEIGAWKYYVYRPKFPDPYMWIPESDAIQWDYGKELQKGMIFRSKSHVKEAAALSSSREHREFKYRTTLTTIMAVCKKNDICTWSLRASKLRGDWTLTEYNDFHTCVRYLEDKMDLFCYKCCSSEHYTSDFHRNRLP